jgi:hypothetical protein
VRAIHNSQADCAKLAAVETVSEKIRAAGDLLLQALREPGSNINERLNAKLNEFLTWPFRAGPACILESDGRKAKFETVIYSSSGKNSEPGITVNADAAACVIHAVRDLGAEEIRSGYESIAAIKSLKRTRAPEAGSINTSPLGIILAVDSALSIKERFRDGFRGHPIILLSSASQGSNRISWLQMSLSLKRSSALSLGRRL